MHLLGRDHRSSAPDALRAQPRTIAADYLLARTRGENGAGRRRAWDISLDRPRRCARRGGDAAETSRRGGSPRRSRLDAIRRSGASDPRILPTISPQTAHARWSGRGEAQGRFELRSRAFTRRSPRRGSDRRAARQPLARGADAAPRYDAHEDALRGARSENSSEAPTRRSGARHRHGRARRAGASLVHHALQEPANSLADQDQPGDAVQQDLGRRGEGNFSSF
jgi:hypothetical protein